MRLQGIFSRPAAIRLASLLSRHAPAGVARTVARWTAATLIRAQPQVVRIVQTNLAQALGLEAGADEVRQRAGQVFYHFVLGYIDFFRSLRLSQEEIRQLIHVPEALRTELSSEAVAERGLVLIVSHTGNFDLAGRIMTLYAPDVQVISLPDPHRGFQALNELRRQTGVRVTPLGPAALRQALKTLRAGGVLATGGDRPVSHLDKPVPFFGRPAHMPSGHVRLALKTGAAVVVCGCVYHADRGRYAVEMAGEPLEMIRTGSPEEDVDINMRRVLDLLETLIQRWSDQWMMFVPVWPEPFEEASFQ
jgi:KDO2-lipid IV(A) lauroyltransferase